MPQIRNLSERHFPESEPKARLFSNRRSLVRQKQGGFQSRSHLKTLCLPNGMKTAKHKLKGLSNGNKTAKYKLKGLSNGKSLKKSTPHPPPSPLPPKKAKHRHKGCSKGNKTAKHKLKVCPTEIRQQSTNLKVSQTKNDRIFLQIQNSKAQTSRSVQ